MTPARPRSGRRGTRVAASLLLLVVVAGACTPASTAPSVSPTGPVATAPSPGADGWIDLFDGRTVSGLQAYGGGPLPSDRWTVSDGALRTIPGPGIDLVTQETFTDAELEFSWAVSPGGNSGVMIGVQDRDAPAWTTGPEYQLLDDAGHPDGADPTTAAAALYGLLAPDPDRRLAPVGEINRSRIVAVDGHVEHWLDDELVLAYDWDDPDLRATIAASKFAAEPEFMVSRDGRIAFQHHGESVWFTAIRIRRLDPTGRPSP